MAERTAEGGVKLALTLDRDGKPFVESVTRVTQAADKAIANTGQRSQKTFAELFGSGLLLRLAGATVLLRNISGAASQQSTELKNVSANAKQLAGVLGTELQAAVGSVLKQANPFIDFLTRSGGGVRGFSAGIGTAVTVGKPFVQLLKDLGISGGAAFAIITALGAAGGTLMGKIGENAARAEREFSEAVEGILGKAQEVAEVEKSKLEADLQDARKLLENQLKSLDELKKRQQAGQIDVSGRGVEDQSPTVRLRLARDIAALDEEARKTKGVVDSITTALVAYNKAFDIRERSQALVQRSDLGTGELINELNVAIAMQDETLESARTQAAERKAQLTEELGLIQSTILSEQKKALILKLSGGDPEKATQLQFDLTQGTNAAAKSLEIQKGIRIQLTQLEQFELDLTNRIGDRNEKLSATAFNRLLLQAQILDAIEGQGPLHELQLLREERSRLAVQEQGRAKTRILELDKQIVEFTRQIQDAEAERAIARGEDADRKLAELKREKQTNDLARVSVEVELLKLAAQTDAQFRAQRIASLKQQLALQDTTVASLRNELQIIDQLAIIDPELGNSQRQRLTELIGLLGEEKQARTEISDEIRILQAGFEQLANQATLSMVQIFTRGKAEAKDWGDYVRNVIEQVMSQLLTSGLMNLILSLFSGGAGGFLMGGAIGGPVGDLIPGGGNLAGLRPAPNLPVPGGILFGSNSGIEARLDAIAGAVSNLKLQVAEFKLKGRTLRAAVSLADAQAPVLKTS